MSADLQGLTPEQVAGVLSSGIVAALEPFRVRMEEFEQRLTALEQRHDPAAPATARLGMDPNDLERLKQALRQQEPQRMPDEPPGPTQTAQSIMRAQGKSVARYALPGDLGVLVVVVADSGEMKIRHERYNQTTHYARVES